ncbi:MAG: BPSS1187 family protein, partial [Humibacter sp.]
QQNRLNGTDPSRFSRVGTANSILRRFTAAIDYLQILDPHGDWGRYRVDGHPVWKNVVFAGHSQGGGESAYISHLHKLRGVLMFSSPVETFNDVSAAWMSKPGATPPERMYGFDDIHDIYFTRIIGSWRKLQMGDPDPTAATAVPTGSHIMLSDLDIGDPLETHGRSVDDDGPRTPGGGMRFQPTWTWMLQQVLD